MTGAIHVGVVGVGRIGAFHARTLAALEDVERLTVVDDDTERASSLATALGAETRESPEALVAAGVDALVVATSTPAHAPLLSLAAGADIPAFCEKPVALELDVIDAVAAEVDRAGIVVQVGFQRRFDAGYVAARDAVASAKLGRLLLLRAATHDPVPPLADGTLAVLTGTRHDPLGYDVRLEVFGTQDSIAVGVDGRTPLRSVEPEAPCAAADGYRDFLDRFDGAYRDELEAFVTVVRQGGPSACTLSDARAALSVALAAGRSRAERRPVSIEEVTSAEAVRG